MALSGVQVFGVALLGRGWVGPLAPGTTVITYRELGAVARRAPFARRTVSEADMAEYEQIVRTVFQNHPILPAPVGLMFRSAEQVSRWIQMNYIALAEGLHYVEGRCEVRVHITDTLEREDEVAGAEVSSVATDCFRALQRAAEAALPLHPPANGKHMLSGAFLVERSRWGEFVDQLSEQAQRYGGLQIDHSGPWPPYDFVRLDVRP
jgi:hypothetical protein